MAWIFFANNSLSPNLSNSVEPEIDKLDLICVPCVPDMLLLTGPRLSLKCRCDPTDSKCHLIFHILFLLFCWNNALTTLAQSGIEAAGPYVLQHANLVSSHYRKIMFIPRGI
jgi:hypothetical protein